MLEETTGYDDEDNGIPDEAGNFVKDYYWSSKYRISNPQLFVDNQRYNLYVDATGMYAGTSKLSDDFVSLGNMLDNPNNKYSEKFNINPNYVKTGWENMLKGEPSEIKFRLVEEMRNADRGASNLGEILFGNEEGYVNIRDFLKRLYEGDEND